MNRFDSNDLAASHTRLLQLWQAHRSRMLASKAEQYMFISNAWLQQHGARPSVREETASWLAPAEQAGSGSDSD